MWFAGGLSPKEKSLHESTFWLKGWNVKGLLDSMFQVGAVMFWLNRVMPRVRD
jgi:hypothetical protein